MRRPKPVKSPEALQEEALMTLEGDWVDPETGTVNGMTDRRRRAIEEFVRNGGDWNQALIATSRNGSMTPHSAVIEKWRIMQDIVAIAYLNRLTREEGLTRKALDTQKQAMDATYVKMVGDEKMEFPDWRTRLSAARAVIKLSMDSAKFIHEATKDREKSQTSQDVYDITQIAETIPSNVMEYMIAHDGELPPEEADA